MKRWFQAVFTAIVLCGASSSVFSAPQPACSDPNLLITLKGQSGVDTWATAFDCAVIEGFFYIQDLTGDPVTSLAGLTSLQEVKGKVFLGASNGLSQLTSLQGLQNLTAVGSLRLADMPELTDISALSKLNAITCTRNPPPRFNGCIGSLAIEHTPKLTSIAALAGLSGIGTINSLSLGGMPLLADLTELSSLPQATTVSIRDIPLATPANQALLNHLTGVADLVSLSSLPGVSSLPVSTTIRALLLSDLPVSDLSILSSYPPMRQIRLNSLPLITEASLAPIVGLPDTTLAGLALTLQDLSGLADLTGLSGLSNINNLIIQSNANLTNLSGLSALTSVTGLSIRKNDKLLSLMGLDALRTVTDRLIINENAALVSLDGLDALHGSFKELNILDNPQLSNARALRGVQSLSKFLYVRDNNSLNECDVFGPIATATGPKKTFIGSNGTGTACADSQQNYMPPTLVLAPASLDFGAINQGSSATLDVTVTAMGSPSTRVKLGALSITDSNNPAWFTIDGASTCISGQNIDSGDSCIITVRVAPLGFGPDQADLRVPYLPIPDPGAIFGPLHASLTVLGDGQPSSNLTPSTSLDFGPETIGGTSVPQTVTVSNSGNAPLTIGSITDDDPTDFPISNNCGGTLAAGATCDITVNFTPTRRGNISGTLTLNSSAAVSPQKLVLTGIGNAPAALAVNPANLDFAGVATGSSTILPATISNTGDDDLAIGQATFSNPDFSFNSDACSGQTLAAGQTCSIAVRFAPSSVATIAGTLSIASNDPTSPASIPLSGIGEEPAALQASPANLNFAEVDLGSFSDLPITLTNTGGPDTSVVINSVAATAADYTVVSDACSGQTLAGGASCALTVRFTPSVPGPDNTNLVIQHSLAASSPTNVGLVGSGGTPVAYINPSNIDFGDVQINTPSAATVVTVGDASASDLAISAIVSNAPEFRVSNDTCTGQTVISGNTCTFEVTALPTALGGISGAVSVVSDSGSSPNKVTLLANGVAAATVRVSSPSLTFTGVAVGGSATQSVTVTNSGGFDLILGQLAVSGSTAFALGGDSCSAQTLAPGASCTVSVDYSRTAIAGDSGSLSIPSNAPQSPDAVPLSAPAIAAAKVPAMSAPFLLLLGFLMVLAAGVYQGSRRV